MQTQQMSLRSTSLATKNIVPRTGGDDFAVTESRWQHTPTQSDRERLDNLIGLALVDHNVHERLIVQHDPTLLDAFDLSDDTRRWLAAIRANSLKEFAQAIVAATAPYRGRTAVQVA